MPSRFAQSFCPVVLLGILLGILLSYFVRHLKNYHEEQMKILSKKLTIIITLLSMGILMACNKDSSEISQRNDVNIGLTLEPDHLDPTAGAAGAIDDIVYHNIFEGLTRINEHAETVPLLAESWDISDDGLIYKFYLKENVRFHNNEVFNADDVIFSLNRARDDNSTNAQKVLFADIIDITKISDYEITITLQKADSAFPYKMAWGDAVMVDETSAETNKQSPIGTGAFKFSEWQKGQSITLIRNDDYHDDLVALEKATFMFFPDITAAFNAISTQIVDGFPNFQAAEQLERLGAQENLEIVIGSTEGETILAMNHKNLLLADKNMRLAVAHSLDKKAIIDGAMFGSAKPIYSHIPPHHQFYQDLSDVTPFDLEKAKAYLAKTNYQGEELQIDLPPPGYARRSGEIIAAQLRATGINIALNNVDWSGWLSNVFKGKNYDFTIISHSEPNDINIYARDDYYFSYQNPEFNGIIAQIQNSVNQKELEDLYKIAQEILANDAVNGFLFQLPKLGVWHTDLQGYWENSPTQAVDITNISWQ